MIYAALMAAASCSFAFSANPSVGLVLSGGGAKGIAHIGFIQAMEEAGVPIDYISGTSMGAIVGSLYAIGYSPAEMMQLLGSKGFAQWSTGQILPKDVFSFVAPRPTPQWISLNFGSQTQFANLLPTRIINPLPMSFAFMELYAPATGACGGDFNKLMVPFRCVASDIYRHKPVVFSSGQLADGVRASMSYPFVFQPIEVGDTLLFDGGLYDVYPVNVMEHDFNPSKIIGVDVSTPNDPPGLNDLMAQVENMITLDRAKPVPPSRGVDVKFDLSRFGLLGWSHAPEIYSIGYKRGLEMADSILERVAPAKRSVAAVDSARKEMRARWKPLMFNNITVTGCDSAKAAYLNYLFNMRRKKDAPMTVDQARRGFYRIVSTDRMRNLVPHAHYDPSTGLYDLVLKADVTPNWQLGVGGYLTTSTSSLIYLCAKYDPLSLHRFDYSLQAWAGQTYSAALGEVGYRLATGIPSRVALQVEGSWHRSYQTAKMVYDFTAPAFLANSQIFARLNYELATTQHSTLTLSAGWGHLTRRFHTVNLSLYPERVDGRNRLLENLGVAAAEWNYSTLDNEETPTVGHSYYASASVAGGHRRLRMWNLPGSTHNGAVGDFVFQTRNYFKVSPNWSIALEGDAVWSTRKLMPTYTASVINAIQYVPAVSDVDLFDPTFRANQWVGLGLGVVANIKKVQARLTGYGFMPMRRIVPTADGGARYSEWFTRLRTMVQLKLAYQLPFGALSVWTGYRDSPAQRWSAGLSIGMLIRAPKFTR